MKVKTAHLWCCWNNRSRTASLRKMITQCDHKRSSMGLEMNIYLLNVRDSLKRFVSFTPLLRWGFRTPLIVHHGSPEKALLFSTDLQGPWWAQKWTDISLVHSSMFRAAPESSRALCQKKKKSKITWLSYSNAIVPWSHDHSEALCLHRSLLKSTWWWNQRGFH